MYGRMQLLWRDVYKRQGIVRWGTSEELKERYADNDTDRAAEMELFNRLRDLDGYF